jgi:hypothetical protein
MYKFLTRSINQAAYVPSQGSLDPNSRYFYPLPLWGEGGVPARPLASHRRGDGTVYYLFSPPACHPTLRVHATSAIQPGS